MNIDLLIFTEYRNDFQGHVRIFKDLGQLQPCFISFEDGILKLRIEGVSKGNKDQWCWWVIPLPYEKKKAKETLAHLIECKMKGIKSNALEALDKYCEKNPVKPW